ncbi:type II toxin-antitoxin system RelE/ParE family toxin [Nevskia sp.]|uniref:type II toxin-antitoxin system RelE/ParE family toxin n=1 Tax=Nevskia sp. TaxID=1929292 RepID=UPI0025E317C3|nr:type II toxin-antitoxin system RelE/ParE family toxin [Nevskia sp.]
MSEARIEWTRTAEADVLRCQRFLIEQDLDAAIRAAAGIRAAAEQLLAHPALGKAATPNPQYRNLIVPFGQNGNLIRYRVVKAPNTLIRITRVWHSREHQI